MMSSTRDLSSTSSSNCNNLVSRVWETKKATIVVAMLPELPLLRDRST